MAEDWDFIPWISRRRNCGGLQERDQRPAEGYILTLYLFEGYISLGSLGEFNYFFILISLFQENLDWKMGDLRFHRDREVLFG